MASLQGLVCCWFLLCYLALDMWGTLKIFGVCVKSLQLLCGQVDYWRNFPPCLTAEYYTWVEFYGDPMARKACSGIMWENAHKGQGDHYTLAWRGLRFCGVCVNSSIVDEGVAVKRKKKIPYKIEGQFIPIRLHQINSGSLILFLESKLL